MSFRSAPLQLEFRKETRFQTVPLFNALEDRKRKVTDRIYAAMSLSSRQRVATGQAIDFPCIEFGPGIDFGPAQLVLFPGEAFVGYQLLAQKMQPNKFVVSLGYGECWPGYIPTAAAFADKFEDKWLWVPPGCEARIREVLKRVQG